MARLISVMTRLTDHETDAALRLLLAIAMFAGHLAVLREAQQRHHQAAAAREAGDRLRARAVRNVTAHPIVRKVHIRTRGR
ncbi:hypothetical protein Psuf_042870 [Phytohabitans suffuscus]|uniref:Uncharacterized protein n=1 Tax=Phytohabitans suffuscus TaxID=624315 RepID=A0A6F8YLI6_9ACTN|nr:hypothetical protein Psuf_042870 [Phytohabitans suffuscus]